jgi:beta-phosphoglucomutase-like phosphatase (HAD superfamily)
MTHPATLYLDRLDAVLFATGDAVPDDGVPGGGFATAAELANALLRHGVRTAVVSEPEPTLFEEAAWRLRTRPSRCAVITATPSAVDAARCGGFALILGVASGGQERVLYELGAHVVVGSLTEVSVAGRAA